MEKRILLVLVSSTIILSVVLSSCATTPTLTPKLTTPNLEQDIGVPKPQSPTTVSTPAQEIPYSLREYPNVIMGKENWLYYGDPMNKLLQEGVLTDAQIEKVVDELIYINNSLKAKGVHFLFLLVPDKPLIYPEFMPDRYDDMTDRQLSSYERMSKALSATEIDFIDTRPILLDKKRETNIRLYYMRDNRWNQYGNFLMTEEIMSHLGKSFSVPQYELISVDTSETRTLTTEIGNDLNDMMQSLSPWLEKGAPEPVYNVSKPEQAPGILWYGDCFSEPLTEFVQEIWPNSLTYVPLWRNFGFPLSFRGDLERRLDSEKIVILELDEHYRQDLSRMLVAELPKIDASWSPGYSWQTGSFLKEWLPEGEYNLEVSDNKVLVTVNDPTSPPSFYSTTPLAFTPSRKYYLVIKLNSPAATSVLVDFSKTAKGDYSIEGRRGQYIYKGDNTIIFEIPSLENQGPIKSIRIYLGDKAGTYGISEVAIYTKIR